jgi:hypothetical protein
MGKTIFNNIQKEIIKQIEQAEQSVLLMLAWFTDTEILETLEGRLRKEVEVKLILSKSEWNLILADRFEKLKEFKNFEVRSTGSDSPNTGSFMHRKLAIIDHKIVMNGAFNWTKNAQTNLEDYTIISDETNAATCSVEFFDLWEKSTPIDFSSINLDAIEKLSELEEKGITPEEFHLQEEKYVKEINEVKTPVKVMEKLPEQNGQKVINSVMDIISTEKEQEVKFFGNLTLKGLTKINSDIIVMAEIEYDIIDFIVEAKEFVEILKRDSELFMFWDLMGQKFPVSALNEEIRNIKLCTPLIFKKTHLGVNGIHIRLVTQIDKIRYIKCLYNSIDRESIFRRFNRKEINNKNIEFYYPNSQYI